MVFFLNTPIPRSVLESRYPAEMFPVFSRHYRLGAAQKMLLSKNMRCLEGSVPQNHQ